jgi:hypothetical protein
MYYMYYTLKKFACSALYNTLLYKPFIPYGKRRFVTLYGTGQILINTPHYNLWSISGSGIGEAAPSMSEAYNLIDELGTASVQDLLQTVSFNSHSPEKWKAYYIPVASDQSWWHRQTSFRCWRWIWGATRASGLDLTFTLDWRLNHENQMIIYFGSESTTQLVSH